MITGPISAAGQTVWVESPFQMDWLIMMVAPQALWPPTDLMKDTDCLEIANRCVRVMATGMEMYLSVNMESVSCNTLLTLCTMLCVTYSHVLNRFKHCHLGVLHPTVVTLYCVDSHWDYLCVRIIQQTT